MTERSDDRSRSPRGVRRAERERSKVTRWLSTAGQDGTERSEVPT